MAHPPLCCSVCGGLFPIKAQYGLAATAYCPDPEHWRAAGLNLRETAESFEAYVRDRLDPPADRRERMESIRAMRDSPVPPAPVSKDPEIEARFLRMLKWLEEPPAE
jgi:hypothetical protein